jgi:DNA-binding response OmpR family regulator
MQVSQQQLHQFQLAAYRFEYHDGWEKLSINGRLIPLTPTEYRLCMAFLRHWQHHLTTQEQLMIISYLSTGTLQRQTSLPNKQLLRKHVVNANGKLAVYGLRISRTVGGYLLTMMPTTETLEQ